VRAELSTDWRYWSWGDELTLFGGLDGSKQPQDFGVNANLGGQAHFNWGLPLSEQ
jgi:hypothetical protein